jgi:formylglycine-generating enzyme required for sulfatase activity
VEKVPQVISLLPLDPLLPGTMSTDRRATLQPAQGWLRAAPLRSSGAATPGPAHRGPEVPRGEEGHAATTLTPGGVSRLDAEYYCAALTTQQAGNLPVGFEYRLPTEAEWEYACRAGTTTEFHYGTALFCNQAQFRYSYHSLSLCGSAAGDGTEPVGSYAPNAFGLYDMHGNVSEWCKDMYQPYSAGAVTDPYIWGPGASVIRGGGWGAASPGCRSAWRLSYPNYAGIEDLGFRVVLAPILFP